MTKARLLVLAVLVLLVCYLHAATEKTVTLDGTLVSASCYLGDKTQATGNDMDGVKGAGRGV